MTALPVRSTPAGDWYLPADGGAGSLLRVADGVAADAVRRIRDLGLPGLLPIGNVVAENGQVWLRTPQPPGPALDDLLDAPLTGEDAVAVLAVVVRVVAHLHARGLTHGHLDGRAVLLDPDGAPVVVVVDAGSVAPDRDAAAVATMARALAAAWCTRDPGLASRLRRCGELVGSAEPGAALDVLAAEPGGPAAARRELARAWAAELVAIPAPRADADQRSRASS
jgi:hypothetical protein